MVLVFSSTHVGRVVGLEVGHELGKNSRRTKKLRKSEEIEV